MSEDSQLKSFNAVIGNYQSFDMLDLRLHLIQLGVDVSDKSDEECMELAHKIVMGIGEAFQKWADSVYPVMLDFFNRLSEIFSTLSPQIAELQPLLEQTEKEAEVARERTKRDIENQRRMQRGGKYKPF